MADLVDKLVEEIWCIIDLASTARSIDILISEDGQKLVDTLTDDNNTDFAKLIQNIDLRAHIESWLEQLNELMILRFVLPARENRTLESVGKALGLICVQRFFKSK